MDVSHEPEGTVVPRRTSGAVEIRSSADGAPLLLGSGHQVTRTLVLTAGHVVHRGGAGVRHRVRFLDGRAEPVRDAELVWHSAGGCPLHDGSCPDADRDPTQGLDLALLRLPATAADEGQPVRWGRFVTGRPHPVIVTGTPGGRRRDGLRGHHGLPATVSPATGRGEDRYALEPDAEPVEDRPYQWRDDWHGVPGAAVFCDGLLIGCVQRRIREDGTLYVLPAARLLQHRCLMRLLSGDAATAPVAEPVELRPYLTAPAPPPRTPAALLDPEAAVVPLVGDAPDALLTWCLTAHPEASRGRRPDIRVRLVTAPSGWGKTRTAVETVRRLARIGPARPAGSGPEPMTWAAGFLAAEPARDPDWDRLLRALTRPVLLVADHAESRAAQLAPLLAALTAYAGEVPVRVLLL
ncbi:Trypsin-like peptidase domain-containing protein, partial [Streptomyces sp. DvalAA-14]